MRSLGLVLLIALAAGCSDSRSAQLPSAPPGQSQAVDPVTVVQPEVRTRAIALETTGKVQFNEEQLVRVNAPMTGRVVEVLARPGDVIEPGHPLFVLDSSDLGQAKSDYAKAVSDLTRSDKALKLARDLLEMKAIPEKDVREAENDHDKAVAERDRAAARLRTLGIRPDQLKEVADRADANTIVTVRAPQSGVIVERNISPGQVVAYGQSDTPVSLFVIANLATMWVLADVYEPDVPKVRLGETVRVTLPCCPQERFVGKVTNIGASVDKDSRTLKVRSVVPNPGGVLKGEMFVKVAIDTGSSQALTLPQSAIHRTDGSTFVLLERGKGDYERRPVKIGSDFNGLTEILEGVTPQDRVVSTGGVLLKRDAR
ncbi:MAG TPA: efflux RND transporter periplasmic adaptor subunit [Candidatus Bathyarchaeia archaeon]|nr:efflux RND transporter periplasmic adaptor subunit [Candidatus Bathyarchaeia archaeon]